MRDDVEITAKELSHFLNLSLVRIGQLAKEGVIKKQPSGKYLISAIVDYFEFKLENEKSSDYSELLEQEKHRKAKRENDIEEQKVAPVSLLTDALLKAGNIIIPVLESLPLLMKRNWPEITGDQITMVKKAVAECRNTIADVNIGIEEN